MSIVQQVQQQGSRFYKAVDFSIQSAQQGHAFCTNTALLFTSLYENASAEEVRETISLMRKAAKKAKRQTEEVLSLFQLIWQGLCSVCNLVKHATRF